MLTVVETQRVEALLAREIRTYEERHARSRDVVSQMARSMPGGDTRSTVWFNPFPPVIEYAAGCEMVDADGNRFQDFLGNYASLVHGHAPAFVTEALERELTRGYAFAAPMREQGELADLITGRLPAADLVRFTNSGTEAVWLAVRLARVVTGRKRIAVAAHSYHGSGDVASWSMASETGTAVFPGNDAEGTLRTLDEAGPLAAVIVEPVLGVGGVIRLEDDFLSVLREYTRRTGALLIFDEVMSFRLGYGGAQEQCGVTPDLTTLGKMIGGGLPIGAVAGKATVMEKSDPRKPGALYHGGTNNGHRLSMVAGAATLRALDRESIERINAMGQQLAQGIRAAADRTGAPVSVTRCGSMLRLHAQRDVTTAEQADLAHKSTLATLLHISLTNRGIYLAPRGQMCVSTAMTEQTIEAAEQAIAEVLEAVGQCAV